MRGGDPLQRIAFQQFFGGQSLDDEGEFPREIVGVVDAGIGPAHAEDRHEMGRVASKKHAFVAIILQR